MKMKILFLCTAHNSLSQRLQLALNTKHDVTIEYALSKELMISAALLSKPDLIICPFLTSLVPKEIFEHYLTLVIHPGPPEDAGPSALDWILMGDDGSISDSDELLQKLDAGFCPPGRSHWGVTVLQAIEEFDAGPVWAFDQFPVHIDEPGLSKSSLYRGPVTQAALKATLAAISRIEKAGPCSSRLMANPVYRTRSVSDSEPFHGGALHHRPLLKAAQREFDITRHSSRIISRRIRCSDSQPGVLSNIFGPTLYLYGGIIEDSIDQSCQASLSKTTVVEFRDGAVCIATCDGKGIWITHTRRPKSKTDKALWPKVPASFGLVELGVFSDYRIRQLERSRTEAAWQLSPTITFQEIWVDVREESNLKRTAYLHFDFYNGAMTTSQCARLIEAMDYILGQSTAYNPVQAVVLMGGSYFSNGIALNVVEAAADPSLESWLNINRINDVIHYLLHEFPSRDILTIAAMRGNAAAGGVALAAACDVVIAGAEIVLNPAYRAVGLSGSEYHTLSYHGRCGHAHARTILRAMTPIGPVEAQSIGLVDFIFPGTGLRLDDRIRSHVSYLLHPGILRAGVWKKEVDLSVGSLARARADELHEMCLDFWSPRAVRYHRRRFDFVRKVKATRTPLRFAKHRCQGDQDEEETDRFDDVAYYQQIAKDEMISTVRKTLSAAVVEASDTLEQHRPATVSVPVGQEGGTVFSCYYEPTYNLLPTPPETPTHADHAVTTQVAVAGKLLPVL